MNFYKKVQDKTQLGGKADPLWIMQEIKFRPYYQMVNSPESVLENETHKILWDFEIQVDHLI